MKLFKQKKDKELYPFISRVLFRLNQRLLRYAGFLQQKTSRYSRHRLTLFLFLLCFVFVTESTVIIVNSFKKEKLFIITVSPVRYVTPYPVTPAVIPGNEYKRIEQFKRLLDSNKNFRDSILATRPQLMDTLNYLQKLYKK